MFNKLEGDIETTNDIGKSKYHHINLYKDVKEATGKYEQRNTNIL